jgi:carbonic anhydrase
MPCGIGGAMTIAPSLELAGLIEGYRRFRETGWEPRR